MQEASKYTELAMNHQWIALARLWLENNAPCSREKMFVELGMLMPDTIRWSTGEIASKQTLVRESYRRIFGTSKIPCKITEPPKKNVNRKGYTKEILERARRSSIKAKEFPHIKHASSLISQLRKKGVLRKNDDGSYEAVQ